MKGISPFIAYALIILLSVSAIALVMLVGIPTINRAKDSGVISEGLSNMNTFASIIKEVASEGTGSIRTIQLQVSDGRYKADNSSSSLYFDYRAKSKIIIPGFTKQGDVQVIAGGLGASASDNSTHLILENEILKVVLNKTFNTTQIISSIKNKITGQTIVPVDSSIVIGNDSTSRYGTGGSSKVVVSGTGLREAEATYNIITTNYNYTILYSLPSLADFITIRIQNTTNINNTVTLRYNINGLSDIFNIAGTVYDINNVTRTCYVP